MMMLERLKILFFKMRLKHLLNKNDFHERYYFIIGTAIVYFSWFRYLSNRGFRAIFEIGPGGFSLPAIALKASLYGKVIRYTAIDAKSDSKAELNFFLQKIDQNGTVINDSFEHQILTSSSTKSIICFHHSLEDLMILDIARSLGIERPTWHETLKELDRLNLVEDRDYQDYVYNYLTEILTKLARQINKYNSCCVIYHSHRPDYQKICLENYLDINILSSLQEIIKKVGIRTTQMNPYPNQMGEIFICLGGI